MPAFVLALISLVLGLALMALMARALRAASRCGAGITDRFTRVHCPLIACVLGASAAVAGGRGAGAGAGPSENPGWEFTLGYTSVVTGLAMGGALVIGRGVCLSGGAAAVFWASSILALLVIAGRRVEMLEAQALFFMGLMLVWSGLPRLAHSGAGDRGAALPTGSVTLAYLLAIAAGVAAYAGSGSEATAAWVHSGMILLASGIVLLPAILGLRGGLSSPLWFGSYAVLLGLSAVPIANALNTGISGALASRASGNPYWLALLSESLALNIYTGGSAVLLPDAFALVVLAVACIFISFSSMLEQAEKQMNNGINQENRSGRGLGWKALGGAMIVLTIAYLVVRS